MSQGLHPFRPRFGWGEPSESHPSGSWFDRPVHFRGQPYSRPDATVFGPQLPGREMQFAGVAATGSGGDPGETEILLRILERLAVQAPVACGHVLRILPLGVDRANDEAQSWAQGEPLDGLIELRLGPDPEPRLEGEGPSRVIRAAQMAEETLQRLGSEDFGGALNLRSHWVPNSSPWHLTIVWPRAWPCALTLHWSGQFFLAFFRAHAEFLRLASSGDQI